MRKQTQQIREQPLKWAGVAQDPGGIASDRNLNFCFWGSQFGKQRVLMSGLRLFWGLGWS